MRLSAFASVKLTIVLLSLIALSILLGAWCPQESQGGFQKVVEAFGEEAAKNLRTAGITDLFHTPFFLLLIALLTVNMIACSFQRVFPKARLMKQKMPFLSNREIEKFPVYQDVSLKCPAGEALNTLAASLKKQGYKVETKGGSLTGEWAKLSRLAATVTHIGLLSLMLGVTITSWTGFNGFKPVPLDGVLSFSDSEHSKLWIGKLPEWKVRVDDTRREDYKTGEAKQWFSKLSVIGKDGKVLKQQEISVNNPLSFDGVDIYQSSWGLDSIRIAFNGRITELPLREMGATHAAFMPLDETTIMIFSLRSASAPLRVFAKIPEWQAPKMLAEISPGHEAQFGQVNVGYVRPVPITGLQYKCDPGLPITYFAFAVIMIGVVMAAFPHRQVWAYAAELDDKNSELYFGGISKKAKTAFNKALEKHASSLKEKFGEYIEIESAKAELSEDNKEISAEAAETAGTAG